VDRLPAPARRAVLDEERPAGLQGQAGPEVVGVPAPAEHPRFAREVALLADRLAQLRREAARGDDVLARRGPDVPLPRAVAALAADRVAREHRPLVLVETIRPGRGPVGVAEQAVRRHRAPRRYPLDKAGGQIPGLLLAVPADGRLEQVAVPVGQVGAATAP